MIPSTARLCTSDCRLARSGPSPIKTRRASRRPAAAAVVAEPEAEDTDEEHGREEVRGQQEVLEPLDVGAHLRCVGRRLGSLRAEWLRILAVGARDDGRLHALHDRPRRRHRRPIRNVRRNAAECVGVMRATLAGLETRFLTPVERKKGIEKTDPLRKLFEAPTVARLAAAVRAARDAGTAASARSRKTSK